MDLRKLHEEIEQYVDKEIELIHSCYLFKNISKRYFKRKIYY